MSRLRSLLRLIVGAGERIRARGPERGSERPELSRAQIVAQDDDREASEPGRRFAQGQRPVVRWIKGNGLDDAVTRAAIGQATRLFGREVDYCLCTIDLDASRVRSILEWAVQPVEWWPLGSRDNPALADILTAAQCPPARFGYWWKWFPERVRPGAPEWILDGDMVITAKPHWFDDWRTGRDVCRISQDDRPGSRRFGSYVDRIDRQRMFYSGLISLPPHQVYMDRFLRILDEQPLVSPHDGARDMCEQGVVAVAFQEIDATAIPLHEFPFCMASDDHINYGPAGDQGAAWGYHFARTFVQESALFETLTRDGVVFSPPSERSIVERHAWLGGSGQWGVPGWSISDACAAEIVEAVRPFAGRRVLELGTSRGHLTAMLAAIGCRVTTVDRQDRGAAQNLAGLDVRVILDEAITFLRSTTEVFDAIVIDIHDNSHTVWSELGPLLLNHLSRDGILLINNARLWKLPDWQSETGVGLFLDNLPAQWRSEIICDRLPAVAKVSHA